MAVSSPDSRRGRHPAALALVLLIAVCCLSTGAFGVGPRRSGQSIEVDASFTEIDLRNNTALLREVTIRQGDVKVQADEATATGGVENFDNNQWVLKGNVRITMPSGMLLADEAIVSFVDNRIARAVITGSPASFEQKLEDSSEVARGRADSIEYDVGADTVRLLRDAFLTDGRSQIRGQTLVYSIRDQRVLANATEQGEEPVHITINPRTLENEQGPSGNSPPP